MFLQLVDRRMCSISAVFDSQELLRNFINFRQTIKGNAIDYKQQGGNTQPGTDEVKVFLPNRGMGMICELSNNSEHVGYVTLFQG